MFTAWQIVLLGYLRGKLKPSAVTKAKFSKDQKLKVRYVDWRLNWCRKFQACHFLKDFSSIQTHLTEGACAAITILQFTIEVVLQLLPTLSTVELLSNIQNVTGSKNFTEIKFYAVMPMDNRGIVVLF
jgi:hypothetical protein